MGSARRKQCVQNKGVKQDKLINISYNEAEPNGTTPQQACVTLTFCRRTTLTSTTSRVPVSLVFLLRSPFALFSLFCLCE
jgi:hypothetical protein